MNEEIIGRTVAEIDDMVRATVHLVPDRWLPWELKTDTLSLEYEDYQFPIDELTDSAHALDWIYQIAAKSWADDRVIAGLIRAIHDIHDPQANICSFRADRKSTRAQVQARVRAAIREYKIPATPTTQAD